MIKSSVRIRNSTREDLIVRSSLVLLLFTSAAFAAEPTARDFEEQLQKLKSESQAEERAAVAKWIAANGKSPHSGLATDAMEKLIADDPDGKVRQAALSARFQIARQRQEPCPLSIVRAAIRSMRFVGQRRCGRGSSKRSTPTAHVKLLIDAIQDERAEVRSNCMYHLGDAANKDAKAIEAIERAKKDKIFDVRQAAHIGRFRATDDLNEYVRYLIQLREEPEPCSISSQPDPKNRGKMTQKNLYVLGSGIVLAASSEERPEELAKTLTKLLDDKSPVMRRGAAIMIGGAVRRWEKIGTVNRPR